MRPCDCSVLAVAGGVDGREGRRCDSAACSICASASRLGASAVQLDRILYWRQHRRGLG